MTNKAKSLLNRLYGIATENHTDNESLLRTCIDSDIALLSLLKKRLERGTCAHEGMVKEESSCIDFSHLSPTKLSFMFDDLKSTVKKRWESKPKIHLFIESCGDYKIFIHDLTVVYCDQNEFDLEIERNAMSQFCADTDSYRYCFNAGKDGCYMHRLKWTDGRLGEPEKIKEYYTVKINDIEYIYDSEDGFLYHLIQIGIIKPH